MKYIMILVLAFLSFTATSQVRSVTIQASGLTCSMCSNAIFKALKSVDFVEKVDANIKTSSFEVMVKPGSDIDFDKLKDKVEDAGFFVASYIVNYQFNDLAVTNDQHVQVGKYTFHFLKVKDGKLTGEKKIRFLDKGFVSAKEYKKNGTLTKMACYKSGMDNHTRIFHVTI